MNYTLRNLVVAALLMLMGIIAVISFIRGERQDLSRGKQEVQVYVAAKDIPQGTPADELESGGYLDAKDVLREDAPANAIGKLSALEDLVSNDPIYAGDYVTLTAFDKTAGLKPTSQIKGNERLFAIPVPASSDAAGLIRKGDHVDIMAASDSGVTWMAARDIEIIETPDTLVPDGQEVEDTAPEADGDTKLYVIKATDREMANIKVAIANADDNGLMLSLRPASGDAETKISPLMPALEATSQSPAGAQVAPDPAVR